MKSCCLCKKKQIAGNGSFFRIDEDRKSKWSKICGLNFSANAIICFDHFEPSNFITTGRGKMLRLNALPVMPAVKERNGFETCATMQAVQDLVAHDFESNFALHQSPEIYDGRPKMFAEKGTQTEKLFCDNETQTEPSTLTYVLENSRKIQNLETQIKELKVNLENANKAVEAMRSIFTEGQVRKLMAPGNINWRWPDISSAICLHAAGPRAYNHLYKKGFPLPHVSTLQRWCNKVNLKEGILSTAIDFMREFTDLESEDKICVLVFDEMKVVETFEYDEVTDTVRKPSNYVQVVMARGLRKSWKQPVFYSFDCRMTAKIINDITTELHKVGFPVVAMVCDLGPTNRKLWKELDISTKKTWFPHPVNVKEKIFVFADVPHLLKLIRNHFLDTGLIVKNTVLTSRTFIELLNYTSGEDLSIIYKVNKDHLDAKGPARQKVKLAAQLFSNTSANAIRRCYSLGMEMYNPVDTADFVQLVNDWFDVHNSTLSTYNYPGKEPFGVKIDEQRYVLKRMSEVMSSPIIPNKKSLEPFQTGILISNTSLEMLLDYVNANYNMYFICTKRLNQDVLENFFGAIRSRGGLNDHPSPKDFKYRLRKYILARNTEHLTGTGNVGFDDTDWLANQNKNEKFGQFGSCGNNFQDLLESECDSDTMTSADQDENDFENMGALEDDALEYVSGYIIRKQNLQEYKCLENSYTWVDQVSKGYLKKPSWSFVEQFKSLETIFKKINKKLISHKKSLHKRLLEESKFVDLEEKIKRFFFKCRIHFRVRRLNQRLKEQKMKQRKMGFKKMLKFNF